MNRSICSVSVIAFMAFLAGGALHSQDYRAYITSNEANVVSVIDTVNDSVIATIPVGDGPTCIAVGSHGRVYVGNSRSLDVYVIDVETNQVVAVIPFENEPTGIAVDPSGSRAYVAYNNHTCIPS